MNLALWRDISIVWLSLFCFIGLLIPIALLYFVVRGMNAAQVRILPLFRQAQGYSQRARQQSETLTNRVAEPIIQVNKRAAKMRTVLRRFGINL